MLNAYLLAKIGDDTAENERNLVEMLPKIGNYPTGPLPCGARHGAHAAREDARDGRSRDGERCDLGSGPVG